MANIEVIQKEGLIENAAVLGAYIRENLKIMQSCKVIGNISGMGLLLAFDLMSDREKKIPLEPALGVGSWIRDYCYEKGMIIRNNGDILVIAPSLTMSRKEADFMLDLINETIQEAVIKYKL
ncbi:MAG: aspartate aminotransferase family protein [Ruminiclostridium sp.]|nr:aspartate aminotransferase family protein [Ruminiclostridium sp.]